MNFFFTVYSQNISIFFNTEIKKAKHTHFKCQVQPQPIPTLCSTRMTSILLMACFIHTLYSTLQYTKCTCLSSILLHTCTWILTQPFLYMSSLAWSKLCVGVSLQGGKNWIHICCSSEIKTGTLIASFQNPSVARCVYLTQLSWVAFCFFFFLVYIYIKHTSKKKQSVL